jgi:DGQHR domain-containing protein
MLATRISQKDAVFYFASYRATDLLDKVKFITRFYHEGKEIEPAKPKTDDAISEFIGHIERSDHAFQRTLSRRKVREIVNFYETAGTQPAIPGTVLVVTDETLRFKPVQGSDTVGELTEPLRPYLIIDGQHRLAGLHFFRGKHPEDINRIQVPTVIFDGRSHDFAAEMFVIINSTHTKINRSHLIDLLDKVAFAEPDKRCAARIVTMMYEEDRSPLQYRINRLGGRSGQEKWILQSELYAEVYRVIQRHRRVFRQKFDLKADRCAGLFIDYLRATKDVMKDVWGEKGYMFTRAVTLKAVIRVLGDMLEDTWMIDEWRRNGEVAFMPRLEKWKTLGLKFKTDGFYERYPAKGQVERVQKIATDLKALLK